MALTHRTIEARGDVVTSPLNPEQVGSSSLSLYALIYIVLMTQRDYSIHEETSKDCNL